jgi:AraC-like DNA-binding protein
MSGIGTKLSTDAEFVVEPTGRHVIGPTYVYGCLDPALFSFAMWGRPGAADATALTALLACELGATIPRHYSLVHFGDVEQVDLAAFEVFRQYVERNAPRLAAQLAGQAVVFGEGTHALSAMIVAGFHRVFPPPYPVRAFATTADALAWMLPARPALARAVATLRADARRVPAIVAQVRAIIAAALPAATLVGCAAALGCTPRTLQRRLRAAGTAFQREHADAQLAKAKQLLAETGTKISAIAREVGFASDSHFSQAFRRHTGAAPLAWRQRACRRDDTG